jgi:hypothetical protein
LTTAENLQQWLEATTALDELGDVITEFQLEVGKNHIEWRRLEFANNMM